MESLQAARSFMLWNAIVIKVALIIATIIVLDFSSIITTYKHHSSGNKKRLQIVIDKHHDIAHQWEENLPSIHFAHSRPHLICNRHCQTLLLFFIDLCINVAFCP